jgi:hypothetical protein
MSSKTRLTNAISLVTSSLVSAHASLPINAYVLGIDASIRCSGIALVNAKTGIPSRVAISRTRVKAPPLFAGGRLAAAVRAICSSRTHEPVRIIETSLEEIPMQFKASSSSSLTRFALARVNGVAAYESWKFSGGAPVQFHYPNAMRSFFGIKPHTKIKDNSISDGTTLSLSTKSNENKKAVLELILSLQPNLLLNIEEVVEKSGYIGAIEEFKSPMSWLQGDSSQLRMLTQKEANTTKFDVADATLAALYGLATHLIMNTATIDNGEVFAKVAAEIVSPQVQSELFQSLIKHHKTVCIVAEARERLQPAPEVPLTIVEETSMPSTKKAKKKNVTFSERPTEEIERLYKKIRALFDKACQSVLLSGDLFPSWKRSIL